MKRMVLTVIIATLLGGGLLFTAYHTEAGRHQRNWTLTYDKGTYRGPATAPLSQDLLARLQARMVYQASPALEGRGHSAAVSAVGRSVRPPEAGISSVDAGRAR